jgi:hypothetical protein
MKQALISHDGLPPKYEPIQNFGNIFRFHFESVYMIIEIIFASNFFHLLQHLSMIHCVHSFLSITVRHSASYFSDWLTTC